MFNFGPLWVVCTEINSIKNVAHIAEASVVSDWASLLRRALLSFNGFRKLCRVSLYFCWKFAQHLRYIITRIIGTGICQVRVLLLTCLITLVDHSRNLFWRSAICVGQLLSDMREGRKGQFSNCSGDAKNAGRRSLKSDRCEDASCIGTASVFGFWLCSVWPIFNRITYQRIKFGGHSISRNPVVTTGMTLTDLMKIHRTSGTDSLSF
jgi:hypothetical protein